jgi:hypothetical protein
VACVADRSLPSIDIKASICRHSPAVKCMSLPLTLCRRHQNGGRPCGCQETPWLQISRDRRRVAQARNGSRDFSCSHVELSCCTNIYSFNSPLSIHRHNGIATKQPRSAPCLEAGCSPKSTAAISCLGGGEDNEQTCREASCRLVFCAADPWREDCGLRW